MHQGHWRLTSTLVFCSIVATLGTTHSRTVDATEGCLAAPKDSTPQGKHWYYRFEHPSKRHCWYLGDEGRKISQASASSAPSPESPPPVKSASRQSREPLQPAVANARAELTNDIAVPFIALPALGQQQNASPSDNPAQQRTEKAPPQSGNWSLAERWPDPQTSNRVAQADTAAPPAPVSAPLPPATIQQTIPQQATAPASLAATGPTAPDDTSDMPRVVLGILTAAIALAAIIGRLILTHRRPRKRPVPRRPIWQTVDDNNAALVYARVHVRDSSLRARAESDVEELLRALRYPERERATSPVASANRGQRPTGRSGARA